MLLDELFVIQLVLFGIYNKDVDPCDYQII